MALLTIPASPAKAEFQNYELNTTDLIALVSDNYFKDPVNWQRVVLTYQSSVSNQISLISFVPGVSTTITASGYFSAEARDLFEVSSISIYDKQNGRYRLEKNQIPDVANYEVDFASGAPLYVRDFLVPNSLQSYEQLFGSCAYVSGGISIYQSGAGDGYYFNRANVVTFVEGQTYTVRVYVKETSNSGPGAYSANIYIGQEAFGGSVASFSASQIDAAVGSFLEATFVANATNASGKSITWVGGASGGYFVIGEIEVYGPPPAPGILAGAYSPASTGAVQNITSTSPAEGQSFVLANPASVTSVKVMISKNVGGSPLTGTLNMTLKASDYLGSGAEVVSSNTLDLSTLAQSLPIPDGGVVCEFLFASPVSLPAGTNSIKYNYAGLNVNGTSIYISVWGYSPTITDGIAYSYGGPIPHVDFWFQIIGN